MQRAKLMLLAMLSAVCVPIVMVLWLVLWAIGKTLKVTFFAFVIATVWVHGMLSTRGLNGHRDKS